MFNSKKFKMIALILVNYAANLNLRKLLAVLEESNRYSQTNKNWSLRGGKKPPGLLASYVYGLLNSMEGQICPEDSSNPVFRESILEGKSFALVFDALLQVFRDKEAEAWDQLMAQDNPDDTIQVFSNLSAIVDVLVQQNSARCLDTGDESEISQARANLQELFEGDLLKGDWGTSLRIGSLIFSRDPDSLISSSFSSMEMVSLTRKLGNFDPNTDGMNYYLFLAVYRFRDCLNGYNVPGAMNCSNIGVETYRSVCVALEKVEGRGFSRNDDAGILTYSGNVFKLGSHWEMKTIYLAKQTGEDEWRRIKEFQIPQMTGIDVLVQRITEFIVQV